MKSSVVTVTLNPALDKTVTVPALEVGGLNRVREQRIDPGGKGINVAKVLQGFDIGVVATGLVAGSQGQKLLQQLQTLAIPVDFVELDGETRTNLKVYAEDTNITTEINENGFFVSEEDLQRFVNRLEHLLGEMKLLVLGGSLPPGVPKTIYRDLIALANRLGVKTILDADGEALQYGLEAKPYAIKPNAFELEQLLGRPLQSMEAMIEAGQELIRDGLSLLVISLGADGALVMDRDEVYQTTPFPITPQSTVGAGDSMVATLAYCLLHEMSIREMAEWTTTAGTVTASKPGTQVCTLAEVKQHVHRVHAIRKT